MPIDTDKIIWDDEKPDAGIVWDDEKPQQSGPAIPPTSVLKRALHGLADPIYGAAQIADKAINPIRQAISPGAASMDDVIRERDAQYQAPEGFDVARMVGNVANPVSWAGGGAGVARAAGQGALQAGLAPTNPDNFLTEKATQVGLGAAGGAVLSKALAGLTPTKEAAALMAQGIQPTVGQSLGGMANTMEQKAASIPLVGDAVNYARRRAQREFEQKVLARPFEEAPKPYGFPPSMLKVSPKNLDEANAAASQIYNAVVPHLKPTKEALQGVWQALSDARQNPEMTADAYKVLGGLVQKHFANFGQLDGPAIKNLDSQLGHLARKYSAGSPADKTLAGEIYRVQAAFREGLEPGLPLGLQDGMRRANQVWRALIPVNQAASARADEVITPRALQKAMARQQHTDTTRLPPDALVDSGVAVLPSNVPDSGTAGRIAFGAMGSGAFGLLPQYLGAGAVAGMGATRPVQRAIMGNTAWQKAISPHDAGLVAALVAALRGGKKDEQ